MSGYDWEYCKPELTPPDLGEWNFNANDEIDLEEIAKLGVRVYFEYGNFEVWGWPNRKDPGGFNIGIDQGERTLFLVDFIELFRNSLEFEKGLKADGSYVDDEYEMNWQRYKYFADRIMGLVMNARDGG